MIGKTLVLLVAMLISAPAYADEAVVDELEMAHINGWHDFKLVELASKEPGKFTCFKFQLRYGQAGFRYWLENLTAADENFVAKFKRLQKRVESYSKGRNTLMLSEKIFNAPYVPFVIVYPNGDQRAIEIHKDRVICGERLSEIKETERLYGEEDKDSSFPGVEWDEGEPIPLKFLKIK